MIFVKIIKLFIFCLLTSNACNSATTGSWAVIFWAVSDLGQNFRIFEFLVHIILLLFEFLESVSGWISLILIEILKIIEIFMFCLLTSNTCNFATTESCAVKFWTISDLPENVRIFEFAVRIILLLFEFLESVAGRISMNLDEIVKIIENITVCLLTSNEWNFATIGSWAVTFATVSDLAQVFVNHTILDFA